MACRPERRIDARSPPESAHYWRDWQAGRLLPPPRETTTDPPLAFDHAAFVNARRRRHAVLVSRAAFSPERGFDAVSILGKAKRGAEDKAFRVDRAEGVSYADDGSDRVSVSRWC